MQIISDKVIVNYLNEALTKDSIVNCFQKKLIECLRDFQKDPENIVPPRVVKPSNKPGIDTVHLFMPCISPVDVGIKVISGGGLNNSKGLGFQGCIMIMNEETGALEAVLNGKSLTAFRTALASSIGLVKTLDLHDSSILPGLTVFGAGPQAFWHVKLGLILYDQIKEVNIINRTIKNAEIMCKSLESEFPNIVFNALLYTDSCQEEQIVEKVRNSSIIFGCSPSTESIIKDKYINNDPSIPKFISLIGSYKPHMIELDLELIEREIKKSDKCIIVDSRDTTAEEAGELIQSEFPKEKLIELADLTQYSREDYTSPSNIVVQKIVGLSVMDIAIAKLIASSNPEGTFTVEDF